MAIMGVVWQAEHQSLSPLNQTMASMGVVWHDEHQIRIPNTNGNMANTKLRV